MTMMPSPKKDPNTRTHRHARARTTPIPPIQCCLSFAAVRRSYTPALPRYRRTQEAPLNLSYHRDRRRRRYHSRYYQHYCYPHCLSLARRSSSTKTKGSPRGSSSGCPAGSAARSRHSSRPRWTAPPTAAPRPWPTTTTPGCPGAAPLAARPSRRGTTSPCSAWARAGRSPPPSSGPPSRPSCAA